MEKKEIVGKEFSGNASLVTGILEENKILLYSQIQAHFIKWLDPAILDKNARLLAACETLRIKYSQENNKSVVRNMQDHELIAAANTAIRQVFPVLYKIEQETRVLEGMHYILKAQEENLKMHLLTKNIDATDARKKYLNGFLQGIYRAMKNYKNLVTERDSIYRGDKEVALTSEQGLFEIAQFYKGLIARPWVAKNREWSIGKDTPISEQIEAKLNDLKILKKNFIYFFTRKNTLLGCYYHFCAELQTKAGNFRNKEIANKLGLLLNGIDSESLHLNDSIDNSSMIGGMGDYKIFDEHVLDIMIREISDEIEFDIIINEFPKCLVSASNLLQAEGKDALALRSKVPISIDAAVEILKQTKKQADVFKILMHKGMSHVDLYSTISSNKHIALEFIYTNDGSAMRIAAARADAAKAERELEKNAYRGHVNRALPNKESVDEMPTISGGKSTPITGSSFL